MQNHNSSNHDEYLLALKSIQLNLLQGRYRRLDRFQEDLFSVFSRIRQKTETDSQVFNLIFMLTLT